MTPRLWPRGWPVRPEALRCLRVSGCGGRAKGHCQVQGRQLELLLDERLELDVATGKRRRLRIGSPSAAELAAAEAAQGSSGRALTACVAWS